MFLGNWIKKLFTFYELKQTFLILMTAEMLLRKALSLLVKGTSMNGGRGKQRYFILHMVKILSYHQVILLTLKLQSYFRI